MSAPPARRPAVFFDRDGTLMRDVSYASRPEQVELLPGAASAVRRVRDAGFCTVLVTNQSGIGRGYFTADDYRQVHARLVSELALDGASLDATYHCPHAPADGCTCRKPSAELFERAGRELELDLERSWCIGDRWRDIAPAEAIGARGILVPSDATPPEEATRARERGVLALSLDAAVLRVLRAAR